jgi:riboflavin kinase
MAERAKIVSAGKAVIKRKCRTKTFTEVPHPLNTVTLEGKVISGKGSGKKYLELPWVKQQMEEKLGFTPYLGTLNLKLTADGIKQKRHLGKAKSVEICPAEGYCVGVVFKAFIHGVECAIVLPQVVGYPENLIEIIAPANLREALQLEDGDSVAVTVGV